MKVFIVMLTNMNGTNELIGIAKTKSAAYKLLEKTNYNFSATSVPYYIGEEYVWTYKELEKLKKCEK